MKTVKDIMTSDVSVCRTDDTLSSAAQIMKQKNVGLFLYAIIRVS